MNMHGGSYPYYADEVNGCYNHPRQNSGSYPPQNHMNENSNVVGYTQYSGYEESHPSLPQQNLYNNPGYMYNLQHHAQHHSHSNQQQHPQPQQQPQHYNNQYQNSYGMLTSNMETARGNIYNHGNEHMHNAPSQNQLSHHSQMRQISQQNPQEIANNILQMATSNYIPNNTVQVPLNKNRPAPYQTPHSPPYSSKTSYNMPMHPSVQPNQHFSYSSHSQHQLNNMRTSPISPMHMNSPMSHHSGQSLPNSSPGLVQSPVNSNSVKSPVPTPPNVVGPMHSPHRKQPLASPTGSTHSLKSPTVNNQHAHSSGSQSLSSPHNSLGSMQSPGHHSQSHYSPVSCSPHSHVGSPYQVPRNQSHSPVNQMNQHNTSNKYMSEPQDFSNYVQSPPFNPLQSLQKLVMLPEKQVVDPKSVVGNSKNASSSAASCEMSELCNTHQIYSKNLTASPERCLPEQTSAIDDSDHLSRLPDSLPFSSLQDYDMCKDGKHCSGESTRLFETSNSVNIQGSDSSAQNNLFTLGHRSDDKPSLDHTVNLLDESHPVENHKFITKNSLKEADLSSVEKNISDSCEETIKGSNENAPSVTDKIENGIDKMEKQVSSLDNKDIAISSVQKQRSEELYGKHKWVKECNASKSTNSSAVNTIDDDVEKCEVRKDFTSSYSRDSTYSMTPKKRYTQRLNYIEKNISGENIEASLANLPIDDSTSKLSSKISEVTDRISESVCEEKTTGKLQPSKSDNLENSTEETEETTTKNEKPEECQELSSNTSNGTSSHDISEKAEENVTCQGIAENSSEHCQSEEPHAETDVTVDTAEDHHESMEQEFGLNSSADNSQNPSPESNISKETDIKNNTPAKSIKQKILSEVKQAQSSDVVLRRSSRRRNFIDKYQSFFTPKAKSDPYNFHHGKNANLSPKEAKVCLNKLSTSPSKVINVESDDLEKEGDRVTNGTENEKSLLVKPVSETSASSIAPLNENLAPSGCKEKTHRQSVTIMTPVKKRRKVSENVNDAPTVDHQTTDSDNVRTLRKHSKLNLPVKKTSENSDIMAFDVSVMEISADSIDPSVICPDSNTSDSSMFHVSDSPGGENMLKNLGISDSKQSQTLCNNKSSKLDILKPKVNKTIKKPKPKTFSTSDDEALKRMKLSKTLDHMSQTKRKREGHSLGPFIHVENLQNSPVHCKIINQIQEDVSDLKNKKKLTVSSKASPSVQISNIPTERSVFLPSNKLVSESEWVCALCKKHSCYKTLGDLFGPYFAEGYDPSVYCDTKSGKKSSKSPNICDTDKRSKRLRGKPPNQNSAITKIDSESFDKTKEYWFHEDCVLWSDGIILVGSKVYGLGETMELVSSSNCSSCKLLGATLGCLHKGCVQKYHFICATEKGCFFDEENFSMLCPKHKDKKLKAAETKKSSNNSF